jgi:phosphate starvation-inducible PhoH-like protein
LEPKFKPRKLVARTENQKTLIQVIRDNDVILCSGPPGTGKTHVAVGSAVMAYRDNDVSRIILCRPVVGVGNDIGFLPGDIGDKIGPYLVPLFDELSYYVQQSDVKTMLGEKQLEIVPLSMMRGRTFNNCFVILDEAQNATKNECRMFLTRLGQNSTMILVGDLHQSDLPRSDQGAFRELIDRLQDVEDIGTCSLNDGDIVRHRLISKIEERLCHTPQDSPNLTSDTTPIRLSLGDPSDTSRTSEPTAD